MSARCGRWLVAGALVAVLATSSLTAQEPARIPVPTPVPIPKPDLERVEPAIARQLEDLRSALDEALDARDQSPQPGDDGALLEAYAELGKAYLAYSMFAHGAAALENAMRLDGTDYRWPYLVARVAQESRDLDRAAELLERTLALEPDYLPALTRLGDLELSRQRHDAARRWYEKALAVAPGSPVANYGLGRIAVSEGRPQDAVEHFEAVLEVQPSASAVHYTLGLAYRDLQKMDKAREHLAKRGEVAVKAFDPLADSLAGKVVGSRLFVSRGNAAFQEGNYGLAIQAYSKAVAASPDHRTAILGLASAYAKAGRPEEAVEVYESLLEDTPDDAVALYNLGTLLSDVGRRAEARQALERAVELAPDLDDAHFNLALMYERDGSWQEALNLYDEILETDPADLETQVRRAAALAELGELDRSRGELEAVLERDPLFGSAHLALGKVLKRDNKVREAKEAYQAAIDHAPDARAAGRAAFELGTMLAASDPAGAIEAFELATDSAPEVAAAHFALARLLAQAGRYTEAASRFRSGLEREPRVLEAHVGRAIALLLGDQDRQALEALEAGLATLGENTTLAHLRARVLAASSDPQVRDGATALAVASEIAQREPGLDHAETVAMALAELGRFEAASELQRQVRARARAGGLAARLPGIEARLQAYESGEPVRAPWRN